VVTKLVFRDHHLVYQTGHRVHRPRRCSIAKADLVMTTEKDAVRLHLR
jgi:tetraacyldisaccharide-1-P 4'-kinase